MPDDSTPLRTRTVDPAALPPSVLLVAMSYWPEPAGSAPMMTDLATAFAAAGTDMTVLTARPNYPGQAIYDGYADGAEDRRTVNGVRIERLFTIPPKGGGMKGRLIHEGVLHAGFLAARARGRVGRHRAVLSLCPSIFSVAVADRFRAPGGRHIAIVHDIQSGLAGALGMGGGAALKAIQAVERTALNRADGIVVLSEAMADVLRDLGVRRPLTVLPPHVDAEAIRPLPRPASTPPHLLYRSHCSTQPGRDHGPADTAHITTWRPADTG
ncbi:glycosyltransferase, partial [Azospirillum argentinense]|uniref:glycosyltransferase n=1 Tax=Azospirillum argentinense TaxID=2970906 RepID=UPI00200027BE